MTLHLARLTRRLINAGVARSKGGRFYVFASIAQIVED